MLDIYAAVLDSCSCCMPCHDACPHVHAACI
jgi:hypothetical protein